MSAGTSGTEAPPMPWAERAAREAAGARNEARDARRNMDKLLAMVSERYEEADPLGAISEGQLLTIERQGQTLDQLWTVQETIDEFRGSHEGQALEMQALRTDLSALREEMRTLRARCDETYALLVRVTQRAAPSAASPKPA